ncbi:MAG: hypothetical protein IJV35_04570 [Neisseriaceae bacterium]|nr:hypothetical protein [Neisseriaceae bacterium]
MNTQNQLEKPVGIGYWLGMEILMLIPFVNLIVALIMSFAAENKSKRNYFRGWLLSIIIVMVVVYITLYAVAYFQAMSMGNVVS